MKTRPELSAALAFAEGERDRFRAALERVRGAAAHVVEEGHEGDALNIMASIFEDVFKVLE